MALFLRVGLSVLLAGALSTFSGCGKKELREAGPTATIRRQAATAKGDFRGLTGKEAEEDWDKFVVVVRKGIITDPAGQYVSDDTWVEDDGTSPRPHRPKIEPETRGLKTSNASEVTPNYVQPCDPCDGGENLNEGAGGDYIYFCVKNR